MARYSGQMASRLKADVTRTKADSFSRSIPAEARCQMNIGFPIMSERNVRSVTVTRTIPCALSANGGYFRHLGESIAYP